MGGGARNTAQIDIIQGASSLTGCYVGLLCRISLKISHVLLSKWIHILIHRLLKRRRGPINHKFTIRDSEKPVQSEAVPFSLKHKALLFHHKLWIISKMADSTRSDSTVKCRYLIIMRFMRVY